MDSTADAGAGAGHGGVLELTGRRVVAAESRSGQQPEHARLKADEGQTVVV
jgi:hypothetical protein